MRSGVQWRRRRMLKCPQSSIFLTGSGLQRERRQEGTAFWIILLSLSPLPSFLFPLAFLSPRVRWDVKDPTRFITRARPYTRVCLDTDVLGSDFRDHPQRRFTVCILEKKVRFRFLFPTFWGLKSYFTQCWNPFPFDFNEVTIKQPPTKWAE